MSSRSRSQFVSDLVDVTATVRDEPQLSRWLLGNLQTMIAYDSAIYLPLPHRPGAPVALNRESKYLKLYALLLRDYGRLTEGLEKGQLAAARTGIYRDAHVFSATERRELPLYAEIIRPQGITSQLVSHVTFRGERCGILYLSRHGRGKAFSAAEEASAARLLPTISMCQATIRTFSTAPESCGALTGREQQIAFYIERGFRNQEIAAVLGTSARTVRNQVSRMFDKLAVTNRTELVSRLRRV